MNTPKEWRLVRSESYGTLFKCKNDHPLFVPMNGDAPSSCKYCAIKLKTYPRPPAPPSE